MYGGTMKKYFGNLFAFMIMAFLLFLETGCTVPSPLYGTWSDNVGNQITFLNDGTFFATIYILRENSEEGEKNYIIEEFQGTYTTVDNALIITTSKNQKFNTEWDLRGAMLYLTWTSPTDTDEDGMAQIPLVLYHNSK